MVVVLLLVSYSLCVYTCFLPRASKDKNFIAEDITHSCFLRMFRGGSGFRWIFLADHTRLCSGRVSRAPLRRCDHRSIHYIVEPFSTSPWPFSTSPAILPRLYSTTARAWRAPCWKNCQYCQGLTRLQLEHDERLAESTTTIVKTLLDYNSSMSSSCPNKHVNHKWTSALNPEQNLDQ